MRSTILLLATMTLTLFVASGVALAVNKIGTNGPDTLRGTDGDDNLLGKGGNDVLYAHAGRDNLLGGEGKDLVDGAHGSDRMLGGGGGDWLFDGPLDEASKDDVISGGEGDDILLSDHVPAVRDIVSCGGGLDRLIADRKDVVADDCERVRIVHGTEAEVEEQENAFFESIPPAQLEFFNTFDERLAPAPPGGGLEG